jgi:protein O-GlcNAc transferase
LLVHGGTRLWQGQGANSPQWHWECFPSEAMKITSELMSRGLAEFTAGRIQEASILFREVLDSEPRNGQALIHLAVISKGSGGVPAAIELVKGILQSDPLFGEATALLVSLLRPLNRLEEALPYLRAGIALSSDPTPAVLLEVSLLLELNRVEEAVARLRETLLQFPAAFLLNERLARLLSANQRHEEALVCLRRAVELRPTVASVLCDFGSGLDCVGRQTEALDCFATAVHLEPDSYVALHLLGTGLFEKKEYAAAIEAFQKALQINPASLHTLNNLGLALVKTAQFQEGIEILKFVVNHQPAWSAAWLHLSIALREVGEIPASLEASREALSLSPDSSETLLQRSACLLRAGYSSEAAECLWKAHQFDPTNAEIHSDFLFASNYLPGLSPANRFANYRQFSILHEETARAAQKAHGNSRDPGRKLRVGYVSGDFCLHSVGFFVEPILRAHDRTMVEVYAYSNRPRQDRITDLLKSLSDHWREVHALSDEAFESLVRFDAIDILVDLSGHTARNRMLFFARRAAPVQLTMVGCMQTTGLTAVDYRITDEVLDPVGLTESIHSEKLLRLPHGAFVFGAPPNAPEVNSSPLARNGYLTFGSLNNSAKVTPEVLEVWAEVLKALPTARIILVGEKENIAKISLIEMGIAPDRLTALERCSVNDYLKIHHQVDVLLDTFPYNGLTVTLMAAWMGVPCLTLSGNDAASRAGTAINTRLGLGQFIAKDLQEVIEIVKRLDVVALDSIRQNLRERTRQAYGDGGRFTGELEGAMRRIWAGWCEANPHCATEPPSLEEEVSRAGHLQQAGLEMEAANLYKTILEQNPDCLEALNALAHIAVRQEEMDGAIQLLKRALNLDPDNAGTLEAVSSLLYQRGGYKELEGFYNGLLRVYPICAPVLSGLGEVYRCTGRHELAAEAYRKAIEVSPDNATLTDMLANHLLMNLQKPDAALEVLNLDEPEVEKSFSAWMTGGFAYFSNGRLLKSRDAFRKAVGLRPYDMNARANLGAALKELFQTEDSIALLRASLRIDPKHVETLNNLGNALQQSGESVEAERSFRKAIETEPDAIKAQINLGGLLSELGRNQEALECFRKVLVQDPKCVSALGNLCFVLNYVDGVEPAEVFAEYRRFAEAFETPHRKNIAPHLNDKSPGRRLRVGYVSADLRDHSVAYFMEPLVRGHNRKNVEVFCYYNFAIMDPITDRFRAAADCWRSIHCVTDEVVERQIREDRIDILVDLSGHTAGSRLLLFARKPAPIQVTMVGCMQSSGLLGMDYRFTDSWLDPEGLTEALHTEKLFRLTSGAFCLEPLKNAPPVNELPAISCGFVRFASFNNLAKVTRRVIAAWAAILHRIPNSRLLIVGRAPERIPPLFSEFGIDPARIETSSPQEPGKYLAMHHGVDVILDPFPYNGLTITSLAAWMGVPCITIEGACAASRAGSAIMRRLRLPQFVASDEASYVDVAETVVSDLVRLSGIRRELRGLCRSYLANTEVYVEEVEDGFREMWQSWCQTPDPGV